MYAKYNMCSACARVYVCVCACATNECTHKWHELQFIEQKRVKKEREKRGKANKMMHRAHKGEACAVCTVWQDGRAYSPVCTDQQQLLQSALD